MNGDSLFWTIFGISFWVAFLTGVYKGRGLFGFVLGLFAGPLGAIVMLCFPSAVRPCPACKKNAPKDAVKCAYCHADLRAADKEYMAWKMKRDGAVTIEDPLEKWEREQNAIQSSSTTTGGRP